MEYKIKWLSNASLTYFDEIILFLKNGTTKKFKNSFF